MALDSAITITALRVEYIVQNQNNSDVNLRTSGYMNFPRNLIQHLSPETMHKARFAVDADIRILYISSFSLISNQYLTNEPSPVGNSVCTIIQLDNPITNDWCTKYNSYLII